MFRGFLFPRRRCTVGQSGNQFVSHRLTTTRAKQFYGLRSQVKNSSRKLL